MGEHIVKTSWKIHFLLTLFPPLQLFKLSPKQGFFFFFCSNWLSAVAGCSGHLAGNGDLDTIYCKIAIPHIFLILPYLIQHLRTDRFVEKVEL